MKAFREKPISRKKGLSLRRRYGGPFFRCYPHRRRRRSPSRGPPPPGVQSHRLQTLGRPGARAGPRRRWRPRCSETGRYSACAIRSGWRRGSGTSAAGRPQDPAYSRRAQPGRSERDLACGFASDAAATQSRAVPAQVRGPRSGLGFPARSGGARRAAEATGQAAYVGEARRRLARRLERVGRRRLRLCDRARERVAEREAEAAPATERELEIERWRVKCVQEVEEKKREQKLKAAAEGVFAEVRKKQSDTKRMADILRTLEKSRKPRKEAAVRTGVYPLASADETLEHHLQRLRKLIKKCSELYEAEERALRVMLEGEQEEERRREMEKK